MDKKDKIKLSQSKTYHNLRKTFQIESSHLQLYLYYAKIAELEGLQQISELFKTFAEGGICNSHGNLDFMRGFQDPENEFNINDTKENICSSISAEHQIGENLYNNFAIEAHNEGLHDIASWFETLAKLKKAHVNKLSDSLKNTNE